MNTETQLARRSNNAIASIRTSALIALFALASAVALADQQPVPATRVAKVSLVGLDISTPEGARAAYERIRTVAERLCFLVEEDPYREIFEACVHETLANAVRRIHTPALAAAQESHQHPKSEPRSNR
jgi:UrcA family protein